MPNAQLKPEHNARMVVEPEARLADLERRLSINVFRHAKP